jgi:hypothetical protein
VGYRRAGEHMGQDPMTPPLPKLSVGVPSDVASCEAGRARSKAMPDPRAPPSRSRAKNAAEGPLVSGQTGPRSGCVCNTPAKSLVGLSVGVPSDVASCEADRAWSKAMPDTHAHPSRSRVRMPLYSRR